MNYKGKTMKKWLVAMLLVTVSCAMVACGKENTEETPSDDVVVEENSTSEETTENASEEISEEAQVSENGAVTILTDVWNVYAEEQKFPAMGGDYTTFVDGTPGAMDLSDKESLAALIYLPEANIADVDEAASLIHGMMVNNFTGAALHLSDSTKAESLVGALKDNILATQWLCGTPDTLVIYTVNGEYVVYAFGSKDIIDNFKAKVVEVYGDNAVLSAEENLAG